MLRQRRGPRERFRVSGTSGGRVSSAANLGTCLGQAQTLRRVLTNSPRTTTAPFLPPPESRILAELRQCRKHSSSSKQIRYRARTRTAPTSQRRRRAGGHQVSDTGRTRLRAKNSGTDAFVDTAFRQQRLKAWQYVQRNYMYPVSLTDIAATDPS